MTDSENLQVGDRVRFKKDGVLLEGAIKSIQGDRIEIDDDTIKVVIV